MKRLPLYIALLALTGYAYAFCQSVTPFWFHSGWTTDDALQQVYEFHRAIHPELFRSDFVTHLMERYLTPLHYGLGIEITKLTGNPLMTAHWMMLIQLVLSLVGMFLAVQASTCSKTAGVLASVWLLHTRPVIQRLTGGLVRGWALPIFCFYLWAANSRRYRVCIFILLIGAWLHPPATFLIGVTHGLLLAFECLKARRINKNAWVFLACAPLIAFSAWWVTRMPADIGVMATLESASQTPEMLAPDGRFAFYPLEPIFHEIRTFSFQAFISRFYKSNELARETIVWLVTIILGVFIVHDLRKREKLVSAPVWCFGIALCFVYLASREFAFRLYVPNRHLQFPCAVFFIAAFSTALSRIWHSSVRHGVNSKSKFAAGDAGKYSAKHYPQRMAPTLFIFALVVTVFIGSGFGLDGTANFNFTKDRRGGVFAWAAEYTPLTTQFAGSPLILDMMPLFGARAVYISSETAHPFFDLYLAETRKRIEASLRGHFAIDFAPLVRLSEQGNDFFVFDRLAFRHLEKMTFEPPFAPLMRELVTQTPQVFYYFRERASTDKELVPFADDRALVVNLHVLRSRMAS